MKMFFPLEAKPADPPRGSITTAALRLCDICDTQISGMGGPGSGSICFECGTLIAKGMVKMYREDVMKAFLELKGDQTHG